jgi:hypothetical protein
MAFIAEDDDFLIRVELIDHRAALPGLWRILGNEFEPHISGLP